MADKIGANFIETSAKDNINVEQVFHSIAVQMQKRLTEKSEVSLIKNSKGKPPKQKVQEPSSAVLKPDEKKIKLKKKDEGEDGPKRKKCC